MTITGHLPTPKKPAEWFIPPTMWTPEIHRIHTKLLERIEYFSHHDMSMKTTLFLGEPLELTSGEVSYCGRKER
jgi:hypothetical protein